MYHVMNVDCFLMMLEENIEYFDLTDKERVSFNRYIAKSQRVLKNAYLYHSYDECALTEYLKSLQNLSGIEVAFTR